MKKLYSLLALLTCTFTFRLQAQITIAQSDMPVLNDTFRLSTTANHWTMDPGATGTNYTWDFSYLSPDAQNMDTCDNVTSMPLAYQFYFNDIFLYPNWKASYAIRGQDINFGGMFSMTDVYEFYKSNSTKLQDVGFGANINGTAASIRKDPIETMYTLPLNYSDNFTNFSKYDVSVPGFGEYKQKKNKTAQVDGWGNLILPLGTFPALRVKFTVRIVDSIYVDAFGFAYENPRPTEVHYHWLVQGKGMPMLQIVTDSATGTVTQITYQDRYVPLGVQEIKPAFTFNVYPNPVSEQVSVQCDQVLQTVNLYDVCGRKVFSVNPMSQNTTLNLPSALSNCTYVMECISKAGRARQKVLVQR